jgi:hypothetical protein
MLGIPVATAGKGRSVWTAFGYLLDDPAKSIRLYCMTATSLITTVTCSPETLPADGPSRHSILNSARLTTRG